MRINCLAQCLTRLEVRNPLFGNCNALAGAGITPHARWASVDRKASEAAYFYSVSAHHSITDGVKNGLDGVFSIAVGQLAKPVGQLFYQITSGHGGGD